eukprot:COSAG02_NODE_3880_length_6093_cov_33.940274_4_plen_88_part_00
MRSSEIENACMVVRTPVALRTAIEATPGTVEVLHAVAEGRSRGPCNSGRFFRGVRPGSTPRKNLPESQGPDSDPVGLTFRNSCTSGP